MTFNCGVTFFFSFSCYLIAIINQNFFKRSTFNKKTCKETLEGKTQLPGVTKINCKKYHFLWVYRIDFLQSSCCSFTQQSWKVCVNQRKL